MGMDRVLEVERDGQGFLQDQASRHYICVVGDPFAHPTTHWFRLGVIHGEIQNIIASRLVIPWRTA